MGKRREGETIRQLNRNERKQRKLQEDKKETEKEKP